MWLIQLQSRNARFQIGNSILGLSASSYADVAKSAPCFPKHVESGSFALVASKEDHCLDICLNGVFGLTLETPSFKLAERSLLLTLSMLQKAAWVSQERFH